MPVWYNTLMTVLLFALVGLLLAVRRRSDPWGDRLQDFKFEQWKRLEEELRR